MKTATLLFLSLLLTHGCVSTHTHKYNSYPNELRGKWERGVDMKCKEESTLLTLMLYDANMQQGIEMAREDVDKLGKFLLFSCYHSYKLTI